MITYDFMPAKNPVMGLKLTNYIFKIVEIFTQKLIRQQVDINEMLLGFMSVQGITDATFNLRWCEEKYLAKRDLQIWRKLLNKFLRMLFIKLRGN